MKNVESKDYCDRPCNCPGRGCRYGDVCQKALIVTIPHTGKYCIGATSQTLKKWVAGRLQSARQFLRNGTCGSTIQSPVLVCYVMNYLADWQGDPFSCSKCLVNFLVSCVVRRSGLRCSALAGMDG
jgi:hypothetical protein